MNDFTYADTSSWEPWQLEYEHGAFYIFPPTGVIEAIDALRETYDPKSASYCQAHISLSEPVSHPLTEAELEELQTKLSTLEPFDVHYGPVRGFSPYPGVAYAIAPEDTCRQLRSAIHHTSLFRGVPLSREHIAPHMTIAEFMSVERTEELVRQLKGHVPEGKFLCASIEYAVPNNDFYFERVLTIALRASIRVASAPSPSGPRLDTPNIRNQEITPGRVAPPPR